MPSLNPVPLQFLCEHSPAKSRVFAILESSSGPSALRAVLTCHDPVLAQRAADVLTVLARGAGGEVVTAQAKEIESVLPAAPAASFREALSRLRDQSWPQADASPVRWEHLLVIERENTREAAAPDFAALFRVRTCDLDHDEDGYCDVCDDWQLTPRTADMLYTALEILCDEAHDDADDNGDKPVSATDEGDWLIFDLLPRITWGMGADWRHQFGRACADLARDLEAGERPRPRCTAEEMALHLAVKDAPGCLEMAREAGDERHQALPEHDDDDYDWDRCASLLFEDHDVLMLFDTSLDGLEDPQGDLNQTYGVGDLRAAKWFQFFAHLDPRDPHRIFRRLGTRRALKSSAELADLRRGQHAGDTPQAKPALRENACGPLLPDARTPAGGEGAGIVT
jgi:hypothetical protein